MKGILGYLMIFGGVIAHSVVSGMIGCTNEQYWALYGASLAMQIGGVLVGLAKKEEY